MLDYIALGVIFFLIVLVAAAIVFIGSIPGKIARRRGHPWPDAVNAASWIGLATGVLWPFAFVWAFLPFPQNSSKDSSNGAQTDGDSAALRDRLAGLQAEVQQLKSQVGETAP